MMILIQDVPFGEQLPHCRGNMAPGGICVRAEVRMMDKPFAVDRQYSCELSQILFHHVPFDVNENVKAENEIDELISNHPEGTPLIHKPGNFRLGRETASTRLDALGHSIHNQQSLTILFE